MTPVPLSAAVVDYLTRSLTETFARLGIELKPASEEVDASATCGDEINAVMGLSVEDERGTFIITTSRSSLVGVLPANVASAAAKDQNDWWGEAANLCVGYLKQALLSHKIVVKIAPPSVTEGGDQVFEKFAERAAVSTLTFTYSNGGTLACLFATDAPVLATLAGPPLEEGDLPKPGDMILV